MESKTEFVPRRYREDVECLSLIYGNLDTLRGDEICTSLQQFGKVCQRDQLKIEAYQGLTKFLLKQYGINLRLFSRKTRMQ